MPALGKSVVYSPVLLPGIPQRRLSGLIPTSQQVS